MSSREPLTRRGDRRAGWRVAPDARRIEDELDRAISEIEDKIDVAAASGMFGPHRTHPLSPSAVDTISDAIFVMKFLEQQDGAARRIRATIARIARDYLDGVRDSAASQKGVR